MTDRPNYITPAGFRKLREEYEALFAGERPKLLETIAWAAANGDRSENADYQYGRRRLREVDRRINFLSKRMKDAKVTDPARPARQEPGLVRRDRHPRRRGRRGAGRHPGRRGRGGRFGGADQLVFADRPRGARRRGRRRAARSRCRAARRIMRWSRSPIPEDRRANSRSSLQFGADRRRIGWAARPPARRRRGSKRRSGPPSCRCRRSRSRAPSGCRSGRTCP